VRSHVTDQGRHLGYVRDLLLEVLDLTQQIALAILDGAGDFDVAAVAIDH
jgi:hypothetical protein